MRLASPGAVEGSAFSWGLGPIGGTGTSGDYWVVLVAALFGSATLALGWRGPRGPYRLLLPAWGALLVLQSGSAWLLEPEARVIGETVGLDAPLGGAIVAADVAFLIAAVVWTRLDRRAPRVAPPPAWGRLNAIFGFGVLIALAFAAVAFSAGVQHGPSDRVGVGASIVFWVLANAGMAPWDRVRTAAGMAR